MTKGKPDGGKYSFDTENRKKIPKKFDVIKSSIKIKTDEVIEAVIKDVEKYFPTHPGDSSDFLDGNDEARGLKRTRPFYKK